MPERRRRRSGGRERPGVDRGSAGLPRSGGGSARAVAPAARPVPKPLAPGRRAGVEAALEWAVSLEGMAFIAYLLILTFAGYFRGLFFPKEQLIALILLLGIFSLYWGVKFSRRELTFFRTPLDWAVFALLGTYALSALFAVNYRGAVQEVVKVMIYTLGYWLVRDMARGVRVLLVLGAISFAGFWLSVLGVGAAAGTFSYNGAFDGVRIYSAMQYPNTLAAYLTMAFLVSVVLWVAGYERHRGSPRIGFTLLPPALAAGASLFVFIFTYSRGGWLVLPLVVLALAAVMPAGSRLPALGVMTASFASALPLSPLFARAVQARQAGLIWLWFVLALVLAGALSYLLPRIIGKWEALPRGGKTALSLALAGVLLGGALLAAYFLVQKARGTLVDYSVLSRFYWSVDALRMMLHRPLLGFGGRGWEAAYHAYQSHGYWSTEVHNHFAQVAVEAGAVGFLAFLAIWVLLLREAVLLKDSPPSRRAWGRGAAVAAAALGLHSLMDFNLSLGAVSLALWSLFGVVAAVRVWGGEEGIPVASGVPGPASTRAERRRGEGSKRPPLPWFWPLGVWGVAGVVAVLAGSLALGFTSGQRAARAMNGGRLEEAISLYREATRYDPLTPSFWTDLGQAMAIKVVVGREEKSIPQAEEYFRRALRLNRFDPNIHSIYGGFLLSIGRYDEGVAELRQAVDLHPFLARRYEYLAEGYVLAARAALLQERKEEARKRLEETLALREEMRRRAEMVPVWAREAFPFQPETPGLLLYWGEALASLGRDGEAEPLLRRAAEAQDLEARLRAEALVWLSDLARRKGDTESADQHLARAGELFGESQNMRALPELMRKASAP